MTGWRKRQKDHWSYDDIKRVAWKHLREKILLVYFYQSIISHDTVSHTVSHDTVTADMYFTTAMNAAHQ